MLCGVMVEFVIIFWSYFNGFSWLVFSRPSALVCVSSSASVDPSMSVGFAFASALNSVRHQQVDLLYGGSLEVGFHGRGSDASSAALALHDR